MQKRTIGLALAAFLLLGAGCSSQAKEFRGEEIAEPAELELTGKNWDGNDFQLSDVGGKVAVVTFGYTSCPDVCPMTLVKMKELYASLGDEAEEVAVIFASVDPHRDSVEKISQYVPNFDQRFYGLHLPNRELERTMDAFDLVVQYSQPKEGPGTDSFYYVDHTGNFFLIDQKGQHRVTLPPSATAIDLEADIRQLLDH